jgi:hypothetical protein
VDGNSRETSAVGERTLPETANCRQTALGEALPSLAWMAEQRSDTYSKSPTTLWKSSMNRNQTRREGVLPLIPNADYRVETESRKKFFNSEKLPILLRLRFQKLR